MRIFPCRKEALFPKSRDRRLKEREQRQLAPRAAPRKPRAPRVKGAISERSRAIRVDLARGLSIAQIARAQGRTIPEVRFEARALARLLERRVQLSQEQEEAADGMAADR